MHQTTTADISPVSKLPAPVASAPVFQRTGPRLMLWAGIALCFTLLVVQYSFVRGRLLLPTDYDDAAYLSDALGRVETWYAGGLGEMARTWVHNPPHSPFSTLLATAAFALFGMHDWAPYACNSVIIFTMLVFFDRMFGNLALRWKIAAALVALCVPIVGQSVSVFRPDMMLGLATAMMVTMILDGPILGRRPRRLAAAGAMWALALWVKPSVFPQTLSLGGLALLLGTLRDVWLARPRRTGPREIATAWLAVLAPAFVLALPYYLLGGREIVHYIVSIEVGPSASMWYLHAGLKGHLLFYLTGWGSQTMLGPFFWIFLAVMAVGAAMLIAVRDRRLWATIACGAIVGVAAYAVPTVNRMKHEYLATAWFFLVLFGAILMVRQLLRERRFSLIGLGGVIVMTALVVVSLGFSGFPGSPGVDRASAQVRTKRQVLLGICSAIEDHYHDGENRVFLDMCGPVNPDMIRYEGLKRGISLVVRSGFDHGDLAAYRKAYDHTDYVIAADPGVPELPSFVACNRVLDKTLALIRARGDFELIETLGDGNGLNYYVFRKVDPFHGWTEITGLAPLEGPYPQWHMDHVRWGVGAATVITLDAHSPRDVVLSMHAQSQFPDGQQKMTILLDGRTIAEHTFKTIGDFDTVTMPLRLTAGRHQVTLQYAHWLSNPVRASAVLFDKLQIEPANK